MIRSPNGGEDGRGSANASGKSETSLRGRSGRRSRHFRHTRCRNPLMMIHDPTMPRFGVCGNESVRVLGSDRRATARSRKQSRVDRLCVCEAQTFVGTDSKIAKAVTPKISELAETCIDFPAVIAKIEPSRRFET